jgi:hypothetical protein
MVLRARKTVYMPIERASSILFVENFKMNCTEPLFTSEKAVQYVTALGLPLSVNTLRTYRSRGIGPRIDRWLGRRPLYTKAELNRWIESRCTVNTTHAESISNREDVKQVKIQHVNIEANCTKE